MKRGDLPGLRGAFKLTEGIPHPNWKAIRKWVEAQKEARDGAEAWPSFIDLWLCRLKEALGRRYRIYHSERFHLLSAQSKDDARALLDFMEMARTKILEALAGAALESPSGEYVVLASASINTYYRYISHYFPAGRFGGSAGVFLGGDCRHFALTPGDLVPCQYVVAHELTHAYLAHLPLPLWVNEGVTTIMGKDVFESSSHGVTRELAERHGKFWREQGLQGFWSGKAFYRPDEGQELSYSLAEIMVRNLVSDHRDRFLGFLRDAHYGDYGESAAEQILKTNLSDYAAMFLGEGDWAPRPTDARSYTVRGCFYAGKKKYGPAVADFTEAVRLEPKDPAAYFYRGLVHFEKAEWDKVISDTTEAIKLAPNQARTYLLRHLAYQAKGEPKKAKTDRSRAIRLDPNIEKQHLTFGLIEDWRTQADGLAPPFP